MNDVTGGELIAKYLVYEWDLARLDLLTGVRYSKHELESVTSITKPDGTTVANKDMSKEWPDFLTGLAVGIAILYNW